VSDRVDDRLDAFDDAPAVLRAVSGVTSVEVVRRVDSTNLELRRRLYAGTAGAGAVVLADEQASGRGRRGRSWHSPPGLGLYVSLALRPAGAPETWPRSALAAAVAACEACRARCPPPGPTVKWPNDVVAGGRKLAGILVDTWGTPGDAWMVIGWGINVSHRIENFPGELRSRGTSLRMLGGGMLDRSRLATDLVAGWFDLEARLARGEWAAVRSRWLDLTPGAKDARVRVSEGPGTTVGVDDRGGLLVRLDADGRTVAVHGSDSVAWFEPV